MTILIRTLNVQVTECHRFTFVGMLLGLCCVTSLFEVKTSIKQPPLDMPIVQGCVGTYLFGEPRGGRSTRAVSSVQGHLLVIVTDLVFDSNESNQFESEPLTLI